MGDYSQGYSYDPSSGNLAAKGGVSYTYGDSSHAHAATNLSDGSSFQYDANGNMTQRTVNGQTYNLSYDAENRLTGVSGASTASFIYNGNGQRVVSTVAGLAVVYVGEYFEWQPATTALTKYYYAGSQRIAIRVGEDAPLWLLGDHLGSTAVVANTDATQHSRKGYKAFGETRFAVGSLPTRYQFTGQASHEADFGLYFYKARWYDAYLNRWTSPDSIIPLGQGVQAFDRYAYVNNSPVVYNDSSGHCAICMIVVGVALVADVAYLGANAMGWIPDYVGIARTEVIMGRNGGSIEVAAGLSVQGEHSGYVDSFVGDITPGSSGYGLAQTNAEEISALGLRDIYPNDPADAVLVMEARIAAVQNACVGCSARDMLVAAALAQNRAITPKTMETLSRPEGDIAWNEFFGNTRNSQPDAQIREALTGMDYQTSFMLYLYIRDLRELYSRGWELPAGITEADLDYLEEFAQSQVAWRSNP